MGCTVFFTIRRLDKKSVLKSQMEFITPCYSTSSVQDNLLFILRELSISLSMLPMLGSAPKKIISELQYLINYLSFLIMEKKYSSQQFNF